MTLHNICFLIRSLIHDKPSGFPIISTTVQRSSWCGTVILARLGIIRRSVPVPGVTYLEATAIQAALAGKSVKIFAAYISPSRPLIGAELTCFGGGLPVLLAGGLNAKHVD